MMAADDEKVVTRYLRDTRFPVYPRQASSAHDFGDDETIGLHVKLRGYRLADPDANPDYAFGRFLGKHPDGFVVGVSGLLSGIHTCEVFETLEELKERWQLD